MFIMNGKGGGELTTLHQFQNENVSGMSGAYGSIAILTDAPELMWVIRHPDHHYKAVEDVQIQQIAFGRSHILMLSNGKVYSSGSGRKAAYRIHFLGKVRAKTQAIIDVQNRTQDALMKCITEKFTCKFIKIAAGAYHSAAITENGELYTWGRNFEGQLGHGRPELHKDHYIGIGFCAWPKYVQAFYSKPAVQDVCCGDAFTMVLLRNGAVYRFGEHMAGSGKARDCKDENSSHLCIVIEKGSDNAPFCKITAGSNHGLLLTRNGEAFATGFNTSGQLGVCQDRVPVVILHAVRVDSTQIWRDVFAGGNTSAAITDDGKVFLWGSHTFFKSGRHKPSCAHNWRCVPTEIKALQSAYISKVLCGPNGVLFFAPSNIMSLEPTCGDIAGGYELIIRGSGFSSSESLTARFIPLTEGRLVRGSVAEYNAASGTIRCQVPSFKVPGRFAVEVALNGKDFTGNGCIFEAYETPKIVGMAIAETRISEKESFWLRTAGPVPEFHPPLLRLVAAAESKQSVKGWPLSLELVGNIQRMDKEEHLAMNEKIYFTLSEWSHVQLDNYSPPGMLYNLELSFNSGAQFQPILCNKKADSVVAQSIYMHSTQIERISPNAFVLDLSHEFDVILSHYDPVLVITSAELRSREDMCKIPLRVDRMEQYTLKCSLTEMDQWDIPIEIESVDGKLAAAERWIQLWCQKGMQCLPFYIHVAVCDRNVSLPTKSIQSSTVYGILTTDTPPTIMPNCGPFTGGISVRMYSASFQFIADNVKIAIAADDSRIEIDAICAFESKNAISSHYVVFEMPSITALDTNDGQIEDANSALAGKKEVVVSVALDGQHYAETNVVFTYYNPPTLLALDPRKVKASTKVRLTIASELAPTEASRVRLTSETSDICLVVPIAVEETCGSVSFLMPEIPNVSSPDNISVAFALNGQHFVTTMMEATAISTKKTQPPLHERTQQTQNGLNQVQPLLIYET
ncbi:unnamed protein product [Albugo candida]|nr:unnamed protein product [Albugo candida]|eukprot:CCI39542.1 unnamed protein product [Albugo candida]